MKINDSSKPTKISKDDFSIHPILILTILFFASLWIYSNHTDLIFFLGIIYALLTCLYGILVLFLFRWRKGISHIAPAVLFLMLNSPIFFPLRVDVMNAKHQM